MDYKEFGNWETEGHWGLLSQQYQHSGAIRGQKAERSKNKWEVGKWTIAIVKCHFKDLGVKRRTNVAH